MSNLEYARPDAIITQDKNVEVDQPWQMLNPCPYCGAVPHDAPDGCHPNGDPRWNFPHCWQCGFRPQSQQADTLERTRQEFAAFQSWQRNRDARELEMQTQTPAYQPPDLTDTTTTTETQTPADPATQQQNPQWPLQGTNPPPQQGNGGA